MDKQKIAIIRIRGGIGVNNTIKDTMKMLRLYKKNTCVVIDNRLEFSGMLEKVKDYVTWGEITEETFKELLAKRAKLPGNKPLTEEYLKTKSLNLASFSKEFFEFKKSFKDIPGLKPFFRLLPPRKGFERKGIKTPYSLGGALGYRKDSINDLIKRML